MKNETTHTPGPWRHARQQGDTIQSDHPAHRFTLIAKLATGENRAEEDANGNLIAEAPAMLEALEALTTAILSGNAGWTIQAPHIQALAAKAAESLNRAQGKASR